MDDRWLALEVIANYLRVSKKQDLFMGDQQGHDTLFVGRFCKMKGIDIDNWVLEGGPFLVDFAYEENP